MADTAARRERLDKLCEPIMRPFKRILAALPPLARFPCPLGSFWSRVCKGKRDEDADAQSEAETKLRAESGR